MIFCVENDFILFKTSKEEITLIPPLHLRFILKLIITELDKRDLKHLFIFVEFII